jgi:hypothetical protein
MTRAPMTEVLRQGAPLQFCEEGRSSNRDADRVEDGLALSPLA